jgi:dolichyl-phosphate-mannose-protein mannosyltransferase
MEIAKRFVARVVRWEYSCLCLLLVINLALHFSIINKPPTLIGDEPFYVADAKVILVDHTSERLEHPPMGKLLIASGIALFGDNPTGWRTFPILFGTINIMLLYLICRRLNMSRNASNIAAFLLTFENLNFIHSGLAMLDVFNLTFMLLSFWLYLRGSYPLSAVSVGLATLTKLTGVFALFVILAHWLITRRNKRLYFAASMALAPLSFLLLMPVLEFAIYRQLTNFIYSIWLMFVQSSSITFKYAYAYTSNPHVIKPWELLMLPKVLPYAPHYFGAISFSLWALILPTFIYMTVKAFKKNEAGLFVALWFTSTYLVWIPITLIMNRVTYVYYFYPAVGAICIGLGVWLSQGIDFWQRKQAGNLSWVVLSVVLLFLFLHLTVFVFLAPINPWPVDNLLKSLSITY